MNATAAICRALLLGKKVSSRDGIKDFGVVYIPREIRRAVEKKFGVTCDRKEMTGRTRWGVPAHWLEYRLQPMKEENWPGVVAMIDYVLSKMPPVTISDARDGTIFKNLKEMIIALKNADK